MTGRRFPPSSDAVELCCEGDKIWLYCLICGKSIGETVDYLNQAIVVWYQHIEEKAEKPHMITNIVDACKRVNQHLTDLGFDPRDADGNDYQRGTDDGLRFKTGTSYGEVAIQVWRDNKYNANETIRVLNDEQIEGARDTVSRIIDQYDTKNDTIDVTTVDGEVVNTVKVINHRRGCHCNPETGKVDFDCVVEA